MLYCANALCHGLVLPTTPLPSPTQQVHVTAIGQSRLAQLPPAQRVRLLLDRSVSYVVMIPRARLSPAAALAARPVFAARPAAGSAWRH